LVASFDHLVGATLLVMVGGIGLQALNFGRGGEQQTKRAGEDRRPPGGFGCSSVGSLESASLGVCLLEQAAVKKLTRASRIRSDGVIPGQLDQMAAPQAPSQAARTDYWRSESTDLEAVSLGRISIAAICLPSCAASHLTRPRFGRVFL
jgi:hypothetical protein